MKNINSKYINDNNYFESTFGTVLYVPTYCTVQMYLDPPTSSDARYDPPHMPPAPANPLNITILALVLGSGLWALGAPSPSKDPKHEPSFPVPSEARCRPGGSPTVT
jgi:hypothetical protein